MRRRISRRTTRRRFLGGALASITVLSHARLVRAYEANERLRLAIVGTMYNAAHMLSAPHLNNAPIVALCDPDRRNFDKAAKHWNDAAAGLEKAARPQHREWAERYRQMAGGKNVTFLTDVRRLFDERAGSFDALVVSHYDHLHGVACGPALRAGKPVLSERPLGRNISEARQLRRLAAETGLPTTYRSPGTGRGEFRRAIELIEDARVGLVREAHVWFKRGGPDRDSVPKGREEVPAGLDWDAWLGPLPFREYHPDWTAYSHWRETCSGGLGVFGMHTMIFPFITLQFRRLWDVGPAVPAGIEVDVASNLRPAIRVTAECSGLNRISFPRWERIRWQIPSRGMLPPVEVTWHHGPDFAPGARDTIHEKLRELGVRSADEADALMKEAGSLVIGSDGAFLADDHSVRVTALPRAKFAEMETRRPQRMATGRGIYDDWIDACRGRDAPIIANFDNGGPLSELVMLGNIATLFPEETLAYDPAEGRITNKSAANEHLALDYRQGWEL